MRIGQALLPFGMEEALKRALTDSLNSIATKLNQVAGGELAGFDRVSVAPPTTGTWIQGDYIKKAAPVETGAATAKYVITGWIRITSGSGNTLNTDWVEARVLTGN